MARQVAKHPAGRPQPLASETQVITQTRVTRLRPNRLTDAVTQHAPPAHRPRATSPGRAEEHCLST
eukprot:4358206-Lingulodinium_polyedra.AAC.1